MKSILSCTIGFICYLSIQAQSSQVLFTPSDTLTCIGDTVDFTNLCPNLYGYTYDWQFGDGQFDTSPTHTQHAYASADTFTATLSMNGDSFVYVLKSFTYHYLRQSTWYDFPWDTKVDPFISVNGQSSNQHNFNSSQGSTNISSLPYTQHLNRRLGLQSYTVKVYDYDLVGANDFISSFVLTIPGGSGSYSNNNMTVSWVIDSILLSPYSRNIIALNGPNLPVIAGPDTVCFGESFTLVAQSDTGLSYQWYQNGNPINNAVDDSLTASMSFGSNFYSSNMYSVVAIDPNGGCQPTSGPFSVVSMGVPPTINISSGAGNPSDFCEGDTVNLTISQSYGNAPFYTQWYKDSVMLIGETSHILSITESGSYHAKVGLHWCEGSTNTRNISFFPNDPLFISPQGNQILCQGDSLILEAPVVPTNASVTYRWYNGSQLISGATGPDLLVTQAGNYHLTWLSSCGGDTSQSIQVTTSTSPQAPTLSGPSMMPCQGSSALLSFQADSGIFYQWQLNGTDLPGSTNNSLNATQSGSYQVVAINSNFCQKISAPFDLQFGVAPPIPLVQLNAPKPLCEGDAASLMTTATNVSYQWFRDDLPISGAIQQQYLASSSGIYHLQVSSAGQCSSVSDTVSIHIQPSPMTPLIGVDGGDSSLCEGESLVIDWAMPESGLSVQWFKDFTSIPMATVDSLFITLGGAYQIVVGNTHGCTSSSEVLHIYELANPSPIISQSGLDTLYTLSTYANYSWMLDGLDSSLSSNPSFLPTQNGWYVVKVLSSNGCSGLSDPFEFMMADSTDGVDASLPSLSAKLYPNPSQGTTFLELPQLDQTSQITVMDLQGRILIESSMAPTQPNQVLQLDLSAHADGIYMVRIIQEGFRPWTQRLIISR
ncbi:MAG: PKD domain-containing protein [Bacteroidota bacterium]